MDLYRESGVEQVVTLAVGDVFFANANTWDHTHQAKFLGALSDDEARLLRAFEPATE